MLERRISRSAHFPEALRDRNVEVGSADFRPAVLGGGIQKGRRQPAWRSRRHRRSLWELAGQCADKLRR